MKKNAIQELIPIYQEYNKSWFKLQQQLEQASITHANLFGRWLLKHCYTTIDDDSDLCWTYKKKFYNTAQLYDIFMKQYKGTAIG